VLVIGNPERFRCGKQIGSYLGLIPSEDSSAGRQKLGHISKQGNWLLRFLLIEATHNTVRLDPDWRRHFLHLAMRRGRSIAQVMVARKLAVRLFWMWRKGWTYQQVLKFGSHVEQPELHHGVKQITELSDWASAPFQRREFELVIMVDVAIEEMVGSDRTPSRTDYKASPGNGFGNFPR
jgi:hypothetical protein